MSEIKDEERDGETEHFESEGSDPALKPQKCNVVGLRFFNAVLAFAFFFEFVTSLISFSASSNSYRKLSGTDNGGLGKACALYADETGSAGGDGACRFSIGGEVILTVYAAISFAVTILKIIGGWNMITCFLIFEVITSFVMGCLSFSVGIAVTKGLDLSCSRLERSDISCSQLTVYGQKFFTDLKVAQATALFGVIVQAFVVLLYIIISSISFVFSCTGKVNVKLEEHSTLKNMTGIRQEDDPNKAI